MPRFTKREREAIRICISSVMAGEFAEILTAKQSDAAESAFRKLAEREDDPEVEKAAPPMATKAPPPIATKWRIPRKGESV